MSTKYEVSANGHSFGVYEADSEGDARDLCAMDAGYDSEFDMVDSLKQPSELVAVEVEEWNAWIDGSKSEDAATFYVPVGSVSDIAEEGAKALGIDVCEELNVERA